MRPRCRRSSARKRGSSSPALVGAAGAAIAVRWRSQFVAALALLGALAAPVLVGGETTGLSLAFMIVALVATVGALLWQRWGWLALGAFLVSAPQLVYWSWDRDDLLLPLAILALYWCLFVVAAIGYELRVPVSTLACLVRVGAPSERGACDRARVDARRRPWIVRRERPRGCSESPSRTSSSAASAFASG